MFNDFEDLDVGMSSNTSSCFCDGLDSFLRGLPDLTRMMKRAEPNQGKMIPHVEAEPNFYEMDLTHPLPALSGYQPPPPAVAYPEHHPVIWPSNDGSYPYGHYHGYGPPPPPPANYPPPYDPYAYGQPPPGYLQPVMHPPHPMYAHQPPSYGGQPGADYGAPQNPSYGQAPAGQHYGVPQHPQHPYGHAHENSNGYA
jgi:hypothetical protein